MPLTFDQLRDANVKRCDRSYHAVKAWTPAEWLMCVAGELGSLAHELKYRRRGEASTKQKIAEELADIAIYLDLLAASLDVDLGAAVARKFNVTSDEIGSEVYLPTACDG